MSLPPGLPLPKSLHWLGDRHEADATGHETDMRGCVMYFDRQSDCLKFMRWLSGFSGGPSTRDSSSATESSDGR